MNVGLNYLQGENNPYMIPTEDRIGLSLATSDKIQSMEKSVFL